MSFKEWLKQQGACIIARNWVGDKNPEVGWLTCPDVAWMRWLVNTLHLSPTCRCDEFGFNVQECPLRIFEKQATTPDSIREMVSLETIRQALLGIGITDWR